MTGIVRGWMRKCDHDAGSVAFVHRPCTYDLHVAKLRREADIETRFDSDSTLAWGMRLYACNLPNLRKRFRLPRNFHHFPTGCVSHFEVQRPVTWGCFVILEMTDDNSVSDVAILGGDVSFYNLDILES